MLLLTDKRPAPPAATRGFTLLEVMIALTIISIVAVSVMHLVASRYKEQRNNAVMIAKNHILKEVEEGITNLANLRQSMSYLGGPNNANNAVIGQCITPGVVCPAPYVGPDNRKKFDLVTSNATGVVNLSGFWSKQGSPNCFPPTPDTCPFVVNTYYYFSCPLDRASGAAPAACSSPSQLNLVVQMVPNVGLPPTYAGLNLYFPLPDGTFPSASAVVTHSAHVSVQDLRNTPSAPCPPGQYVNGYDQSGAVICACYGNQPAAQAGGGVSCNFNTCASWQVFTGYITAADGSWVPNCQSPQLVGCYPVSLNGGFCAYGYFIVDPDLSRCHNYSNPSGGYISVICDGDTAYCCMGNF